jgi:hypothetical protein
MRLVIFLKSDACERSHTNFMESGLFGGTPPPTPVYLVSFRATVRAAIASKREGQSGGSRTRESYVGADSMPARKRSPVLRDPRGADELQGVSRQSPRGRVSIQRLQRDSPQLYWRA